MNSEDKRKIKIGIAIAAFAVILYFVLQSVVVWKYAFSFLAKMLSPFIYGICFAFVLNILAKFFDNKVFSYFNKKKSPVWMKIRHPVCIVTTIIVFLGIVAALVSFIIPQLVSSTATLVSNVDSYLGSLQTFINGLLSNFGISTDLNQTVTSYLTEFSDTIINFITKSVPNILETTMNITTSVFNVFFGFIIGIYMLATKESLLRNLKRMVYAFLPRKWADNTNYVYRIVNQRFNGFVSGQLTEAVILGVLCFIGMKIFKMEYALLISVIIGITNIIPIVGPIIGAVPGVVIMLMIDPMKAVWFVVFVVVLQQIESNLIYPKVVGDSIGLPGLWVIFAIIVGGGLFGFAGVILGVPAFAVIYTLIAENTTKRLKEKSIKL